MNLFINSCVFISKDQGRSLIVSVFRIATDVTAQFKCSIVLQTIIRDRGKLVKFIHKAVLIPFSICI